MTSVVLGIDIGGTGIKFGLIDRNGRIIFSDKTKTNGYPNAEKLPEDLFRRTSLKTKELKLEIKGVGIGTPNGNYFTGIIEMAPNLPWEKLVPMKILFEKHFNLPVALTNDAKAAALGEMFYGDAQNVKDFLFITLGTGLGCGIVVNGNIVYGHDSLAGEVGHIIIHADGRFCGCGRNGCLEQYVSATGLVKTYYELLRSQNIEQFRISLGNMIAAEEISKKAAAGDSISIETFNYTGEILGLALANSVCYTRPEKIFLFGGLAQAGDLIFNPTIESFEKNLLPVYKNKIQILPSGLKESEAAILGAASLIWKELE